MRLYSILLFFICLNLSGYAISTLVTAEVLVANKEVMPYGSTEILSQFDIYTFTAWGIGAGIAGLIGLITKQYVFAAGATLIWTLGIMFNVSNWILNGFPRMIGILIGGSPELAPFSLLVQSILTTMLTFYLFFFLAEILSQKPMVS